MNTEQLQQVFSKGVPLMRPARFAELTGINDSTVITMMDRDQLPVIRLNRGGKKPTRYINIVELVKICSEEGAS